VIEATPEPQPAAPIIVATAQDSPPYLSFDAHRDSLVFISLPGYLAANLLP